MELAIYYLSTLNIFSHIRCTPHGKPMHSIGGISQNPGTSPFYASKKLRVAIARQLESAINDNEG